MKHMWLFRLCERTEVYVMSANECFIGRGVFCSFGYAFTFSVMSCSSLVVLVGSAFFGGRISHRIVFRNFQRFVGLF